MFPTHQFVSCALYSPCILPRLQSKIAPNPVAHTDELKNLVAFLCKEKGLRRIWRLILLFVRKTAARNKANNLINEPFLFPHQLFSSHFVVDNPTLASRTDDSPRMLLLEGC